MQGENKRFEEEDILLGSWRVGGLEKEIKSKFKNVE